MPLAHDTIPPLADDSHTSASHVDSDGDFDITQEQRDDDYDDPNEVLSHQQQLPARVPRPQSQDLTQGIGAHLRSLVDHDDESTDRSAEGHSAFEFEDEVGLAGMFGAVKQASSPLRSAAAAARPLGR